MIAESLLYISLSLVPIEDFNPNKNFYLFILLFLNSNPDRTEYSVQK